MAIKQVEMAVCDFKHKHDMPAIARIEIDVCSVHNRMFEDREPDPLDCPHCDRTFASQQGLNKHIGAIHPGKSRVKAV